MTLNDIIRSIARGEFDDDIDTLADVVRNRHASVRERNASINRLVIAPGDRVVLSGLSPKYLNGMTATVVADSPAAMRKRKATLSVKLDYEVGRFATFRTIAVPAQCVTKVKA